MSTTFDDLLLNIEYSAIAAGGANFSTALIGSGEGGIITHRASTREDYISQYEIDYKELGKQKKKDLRTFAILREGMARAFRFLAPDIQDIENQSVGKLNPATAEISRVGLTDGATREFFIIEYLSDPANNYLRWITKPSPVEDWVIEILDDEGNPLESGTFPGGYNYNPFAVLPVSRTITLPTLGAVTLYYRIGKLYFQDVPAANHQILLSGQIHIPVVFMDDWQKIDIDDAGIGEFKVQLKEVLPIEIGLSPEKEITAPFEPHSVSLVAIFGSVSGTYEVSASVLGDSVGVRLLIDGEIYGTEQTGEVVFEWNTLDFPNGEYNLQAYSRDASGNLTYSEVLPVTVDNDYVAPTVSITPLAPGTVSGTILITANPADNVAVDRVEFYLGIGNYLGADFTPPYQWSFNSTLVPNGTQSIGVIAFDEAGNQSEPAFITFEVNN